MSIFKSRRIYLWWSFFVVMGVALKLLPMNYQDGVCDIYKTIVAVKLRDCVSGLIGNDDGAPRSESAAVSDTDAFLARVEQYFCPGEPRESKLTAAAAGMHAVYVAPGACVLATLVCLLLPARPGTPPRVTTKDVTDAEQAVELSRDQRRLVAVLRDFQDLAVRACQFRALIIYVLASGGVTFFIRPEPGAIDPFWTDRNIRHVLAIALTVCVATVWATKPAAIKYRRLSAVSLAGRIGFGGIFFAGLATLAVALPYRIIAEAGAAGLAQSQVEQIVIARLVYLPIIGMLASFACVAASRRFGGMPVRLLDART